MAIGRVWVGRPFPVPTCTCLEVGQLVVGIVR